MNKMKANFWIDAVLLMLFILVLLPGATGIDLHQGIGIALGGGAAIHLLLHWTWIKTVFAHRKSRPGRVQRLFWLDAALGLSFVWTVFSGLMISPLVGSPALRHMAPMHHLGALLVAVFATTHLILHRKWLTQGARRYLLGGVSASRAPSR